MKQILNAVLAAALSLFLVSCGTVESGTAEPGASGSQLPAQQQEQTSVPDHPTTSEQTAPETPAANITTITISAGGRTFSATLLENESARRLAEMLPLTLDMDELNGNEKYFYLDNDLPTDSCQPGQINAGDLMLYGDKCLVLFYKTFSSGYSYTRLGSVDDPAGLAEALGTGSVTVRFSVGD